MKKNAIFLLAALTLAACQREAAPEVETVADFVPGPTAFTAQIEADPASKAVIGLNDSSKPQTFWENGDAISIYSSNDTDLKSTTGATGHKFVTTLDANATEATFVWDGTGNALPAGDYLATYPYRSAGRGVNFKVSPYRVAAVDVPKAQTLEAGSYDRKACPMVAFAAQGSNSMQFKNAAALLKFRVAEDDIVAGRIEVDAADKISGRFRADVNTTTHVPTLETYTASGVEQYNYIDFKIDGTTAALATETDYYVAIRPTTLSSGIKIYLNGNLVKSINASQLAAIERNKIYNLGTLSTPATPAEKKLTFDFTVTPKTGWPTSGGTHHGNAYSYPLYGTDYSFILTDCENATKCQVYWATNSPGKRLALAAQYRYLGFPAIEGYQLVQVICVNKQLSASDTSTNPRMGITKQTTATNTAAPDNHYVTGGELQNWEPTGGGTYTYNLSGTENNTVYYLYALAKGAVATLTLTYTPI